MRRILAVSLMALLAFAVVSAQQKNKLTNDAVISMVKGGLPDSIVVGSIQSSEPDFDLSPAGLEKLKQAGVSARVIAAMQAAQRKIAAPAATRPGAAPAAARADAPTALPTTPPFALVVEGDVRRALTAETAKVVSTDAKQQALDRMAADAALNNALQQMASAAAYEAAAESGSAAAGSFASAAAGALGGLMRRKPQATFVWAVPGAASGQPVTTPTPKFEVAWDVPGLPAADYVPALIRLVPAQNQVRLVGATRGDADALGQFGAEWALYEKFTEMKVPATVTATAPGRAEIAPAAALGPGQYAIVLRPVGRKKKFSGAEVAAASGEAQLFNAAWTFTVALQ